MKIKRWRSPVTLVIPISHEIQMFDERDKRKSGIGLVTSAVRDSFFVIDLYCSSENMWSHQWCKQHSLAQKYPRFFPVSPGDVWPHSKVTSPYKIPDLPLKRLSFPFSALNHCPLVTDGHRHLAKGFETLILIFKSWTPCTVMGKHGKVCDDGAPSSIPDFVHVVLLCPKHVRCKPDVCPPLTFCILSDNK